MADILGYQGNAGLAFGSGGDNGIGQVGVYDFNPIAQSLQALAKRRNDVADTEYQQKIADRNTLFNKLATMELALDKTLPEQRDGLKQKISEVEKLYLEHPDILSNPDAYVKLMGKLRDFNELDSYAKANYVTTTKDLITANNIADPDDRQKYLDHIQQQRDKLKDNPYDLYSPFQKKLEMDFQKMAPEIAPTTKVLKQGPNFQDETVTYKDPKKLVDYYRTNVLEGNNKSVANMFDEMFNSYGLKSPAERTSDFDAINAKVDAANKYMPEGQKLKPIVFDRESGKVDLDKMTKDDFNRAVMVGLRFDESTGTGYNKDRALAAKAGADINAKNAAAQAALMRANSDRAYKGIMGAAASKKADAYAKHMAQALKGAKTQEEADQVIDEMYTRNYQNQPKVIESVPGNNSTTKFKFSNIDAQNSLPLYTIKGAKGPEELVPIDSKPVYNAYGSDGKPTKTAKIIGHSGGYFEPIYMYANKRISGTDMGKLYDSWKAEAKTSGLKWTGSLDDWMKERIADKDLELLIRGANGTTDRRLSLAAQRIITNKNTKKGQDGVFEPPADDAVADETPAATDPE